MKRFKQAFLVMGVAIWCLCLSLVGLSSTLDAMAEAVAEDVGLVLDVVEGDPDRLIFVFEERHDSILLQLELALMLNRMYVDYGMRHIGLEGVMSEEGQLDLSWAHWPPAYRPGQLITAREDVLVQSLMDGEIGGVELLGLIYEDVVVDGIDDAELYAVKDPDQWFVPYTYLYNIALSGMTSTEYDKWKPLYDQEKYQEALEFAMSTDTFTAERFARLEDPVDYPSEAEWLEIVDEVKMMAKLRNAQLPEDAEKNLDELRAYLGVLLDRSNEMAENTLNLVERNDGVPVAIDFGAMHTDILAKRFTEAGVSFVVIRTQAQAEASPVGLLSREAYDRRTEGLSTAPEGTLAALLDGRKRAQSVAEKQWYIVKELVSPLLQLFATQAASLRQKGPGRTDLDIENELKKMLERVDPSYIAALRSSNATNLQISDVSTRRESNPEVAGEEHTVVIVTVAFDYKDPLSGKVKQITAQVWALAGENKKGMVTFEELLTKRREALSPVSTNPTEEMPSATTPQKPVSVCSGVEGTFTAKELAG